MKRIRAAFQFLTIIPIRIKGELSDADISGSAVFFPLVGFLQGVLLAAISFVCLKFLSPAATSILVIAAYLLTNGGFHQDGLSDTFDALSVKSIGDVDKDRRKRLAVMRDPSAGPIGVAAIVLSLLLKYTLLKEILEGPGHAFFSPAVLLMPAVAAWSMTMAMPGARSARSDGLGQIFLGRVKASHACLATILLVLLSCIACPLTGHPAYDNIKTFFLFFVVASFAALCAGYVLRRLCTARFGGLTGDNLGAIHEAAETMLLFAAVLCF